MISYSKSIGAIVILITIYLLVLILQVWQVKNNSSISENLLEKTSTPTALADVNFTVFEHRSSDYTTEEVNSALHHANMFFYLVETENPFFICMPPKTGSTEWKALFAFVDGAPNYLKVISNRTKVGAIHADEKFKGFRLSKLPKNLALNRLKNSSRLLITRNPYDRFLSGYFDWLGRNGITENVVPFNEFLIMAEKKSFPGFKKGTINSHHCESVSVVSKYDKTHYSAILRLEEQDIWYNSFVKEYKLEPFLSKLQEEETPFYQTNTKMNDPLSTKMEGVIGKSSWKGTYMNKDSHSRGTASKLFDYYTPEIADRVFNLYRDDFKNFGYPAWNGDPATFRYHL